MNYGFWPAAISATFCGLIYAFLGWQGMVGSFVTMMALFWAFQQITGKDILDD